jgi:predicted amidohydrolase YtcJ
MRTVVTADTINTGTETFGHAMAFENGTVVGVGAKDDLYEVGDRLVNYEGAHIVPGFRDAHIHAIPYAALLSGCSLKSASSMDDLLDRLGRYASTLPNGAPVVASRLDDETLAERRLPTREDLDRAVPDRPAVIYRYCGHVAVANSTALAESGIDATTEDPTGGVIDRDASGSPTGVLRETATGLIAGALARGGPLSPNQLIDGLTRLGGLGITSIGAMIGYGESPYEKLEAESVLFRDVADRLPVKVHGLSIASTPDDLAASAAMLDGAGSRLRWLGVKRFSDGSLGGHTAAMCSPFADVDTVGTYRLTDADIDVARKSIEMGGMVAIHAIGDWAISAVLDVFATLITEGAQPDRLRMEHVSVAGPELISRFASTGATAVVQPAFLASESGWLGKRLGPERAAWAYPFRSMADAGITLAGSSDSIVEPPHPLWGIAAAMDRHGIGPDEALSGQEALTMFTVGGAHALAEPAPLWLTSPADFVVLDTDITTATPQEVHDAEVLDTWIDGEPLVVDRSLPTWVD